MSEAFLSQLKLDGGTQMRSNISMETVSAYAELIADGANFPAVVAFYDGTDYWLADGFHRHAAYKQANKKTIPTDIRAGDRIDAIRYALKANATNGRPRTSDDMRRAYRAAVDNGLCSASDSNEVCQLLGCSTRWARTLTQNARQEVKADRNIKIIELAEQGKSQREIAAEVSVDVATVNRAVAKRNSSEMQHAENPDPATQELTEQQERPKSRGDGVKYAHEAIAVLKRIPLSDGLRQDAFNMVSNWIETNRSNQND